MKRNDSLSSCFIGHKFVTRRASGRMVTNEIPFCFSNSPIFNSTKIDHFLFGRSKYVKKIISISAELERRAEIEQKNEYRFWGLVYMGKADLAWKTLDPSLVP